jgi:Leucine-rich repeat (LRR) protein
MTAPHTPCTAKVCQVALNTSPLKKRWIPLDLVQNTAEYLGRVSSLLSFRGVSTGWQGAVSDAMGFVNGRCWTELKWNSRWTMFVRCKLLCLVHRLETLEWRYVNDLDFVLRLLGENNTVLTTLYLNVSNSSKRTADASCLRSCCALKKLVLSRTSVTDAGIRGLELIPTLEDLDLSSCKRITDVGFLQSCRALKKLDLSYTTVTDRGIRGLEFIPTLKDLDLSSCTRIMDVSCLRSCRGLTKLDLTNTGVWDAGILGLELIPTLEDLKLSNCGRITHVSCLRSCPALKKLFLSYTSVADAGICGLELIPTLEELNLWGCSQVHDLSVLQNRPLLRLAALFATKTTTANRHF